MTFYSLLLLPLVSAAIGWGTNYLALKMLFHPRRPWSCLFFSVQGIFPKRQGALAQKIGETIERELISHQDIQAVIRSPEFLRRFHVHIDEHADRAIKGWIAEVSPTLSILIPDRAIELLKRPILHEIYAVLPDMVEKATEELESRLDFSDLVRRKIEAYPPEKLEEILFSIMRKEFRFIEWVGGVIGGIIGLIQAILLALGG